MRVVGVDLAWGEGSAGRAANESGLVAIEPDGHVVAAGWSCGLDDTLKWLSEVSETDTLAMIDAPLVVTNERGQRSCETAVGQRYGRWKVSANSTNLASSRLAGQTLRQRLEAVGWAYEPGWSGPRERGRSMSECYPYATLVGANELGYDVERPTYKRKPKATPTADLRALRAAACDDLIRRLAGLATADPPLLLHSHPVTARLLDERSPLTNRDYKHREDLIDAAICAWTGSLWLRGGVGALPSPRRRADGPPRDDHRSSARRPTPGRRRFTDWRDNVRDGAVAAPRAPASTLRTYRVDPVGAGRSAP